MQDNALLKFVLFLFAPALIAIVIWLVVKMLVAIKRKKKKEEWKK